MDAEAKKPGKYAIIPRPDPEEYRRWSIWIRPSQDHRTSMRSGKTSDIVFLSDLAGSHFSSTRLLRPWSLNSHLIWSPRSMRPVLLRVYTSSGAMLPRCCSQRGHPFFQHWILNCSGHDYSAATSYGAHEACAPCYYMCTLRPEPCYVIDLPRYYSQEGHAIS